MRYHKNNFKSIGKLIEPLIKKNGRANIISYSNLLQIWEAILGADIARKAKLIRIKPLKGGQKNSLYLGLTGPYMAEISLQIQYIIDKINSYYAKEVVVQIKLQRLHDINKINVVKFDNSEDFRKTKNEEPFDPKPDIVLLENAITKMKTNLDSSRKKNEIMED